MKIISMIFAAILLSGCGTTPIPSSAASPVPVNRLWAYQSPLAGGHGVIVVTRDTGHLGRWCNLDFAINGVSAAKFGPGETAKFFVGPGEVVFRVSSEANNALCGLNAESRRVERETNIKTNELKFFRISLDPNGTHDIQRSELN